MEWARRVWTPDVPLPDPGGRAAISPVVYTTGVYGNTYFESVTQTLALEQSVATPGAPLATGRYRR